MMESPLFRIRELLRAGESLSPSEIAQRLELARDLVDAGLQHWQSRGELARVQNLTQVGNSSCANRCAGTCSGCTPPAPPVPVEARYRWRAQRAA
ncbi:hypothetical protein AB4090_06430 [Acidithiobacillus sp. IBUN Pt1247-S3]|uniref:hypothetical protein n=1 Tax=Acidithiobacillus sp. IBUN Pt1247-S3 TaxID=3166642 RepID=UPI0034E49BF9